MTRRLWPVLLIAAALLLTLARPQLAAQTPPPSQPLIRLRAGAFDPLAGEPQLAQPLRTSAAAAGAGPYLLQFTGPVTEAWKAEAARAGARLYGYIPEHAFIARIAAADLARVQALPSVRWVGPYHPAYRLDAELQAAEEGARSLVVQTFPDADLAALAAQIGAWGGTVAGSSAGAIAGYLRAELPAARLAELAARPEVVWVGPHVAPRLLNNVGGGQIMRAGELRESLGLFGAGQIVAVADSGFDKGDSADLPQDLSGRLVRGYCLGRPSPCDWGDPDGHGTHVAGSVLGSGAASGSTPASHQYPAGAFAGVAPEAGLVMQSIMDDFGSLGGIPEDVGDLMRQAYADGARIHTNSWGGPTGGTSQSPQYGGYVVNSQQADQAAWEHKDMLILFAGGNSGEDVDRNGVIDGDSIGQPGTAKNVLTIGASESVRPDENGSCTWGFCFGGFEAAPLAGDNVSDNANGMAAFSSRGPTDDGRIKPDLVAPGTNIISLRSRHPDAGVGWGEHNADYVFQGGTSMATPLAAGAAALVREWLTSTRGVASPSAALLRSLLINGAADMSPGQYGSGPAREIQAGRPNTVAGWGRVDLVESLDPAAPRAIWFADDQSGLATGASARYQVTVGAPAAPGPLRLTLSWTDYPGEPAGAKALVNDLDLEVIGPDGTRYRGNSGLYASGQCLRDAKWDACNNTEGVFVASAAPGTYTVLVYAAQVAQGGRQPFALAGSGNDLKPLQVSPTSTPTATASPTVTASPTATTTPVQPRYRQYLPALLR